MENTKIRVDVKIDDEIEREVRKYFAYRYFYILCGLVVVLICSAIIDILLTSFTKTNIIQIVILAIIIAILAIGLVYIMYKSEANARKDYSNKVESLIMLKSPIYNINNRLYFVHNSKLVTLCSVCRYLYDESSNTVVINNIIGRKKK